MTFDDHEDRRPRPPGGGPGRPSPGARDPLHDPDVWSDPADGGAGTPPAPTPRPARRGPRPPAARARRVARPGRTGAVPAGPVSGQVPAVTPPTPSRPRRPVAEQPLHVEPGYDEAGYDEAGYDEAGYDEAGYDEPGYDDGGYREPVADDDGDWVDLPRERRFPRAVVVLLVLAVLAGVTYGGANWWYQRQIDPPGEPGELVSVQIPEGSSLSRIGDILDGEGVVSSSLIFNFYAGRKDAGPFQAGSYQFQKNSDFDTVLDRLAAGPGKPVVTETTKVTIPEGLRLDQVLARINEAIPRFAVADLQAALDSGAVTSTLKASGQDSWEGLLFPATYDVADDETPEELLNEMAVEMQDRITALGLDDGVARVNAAYGLDLTPYDLLTTASMVQAEAGGPEEAAKIATVIYNRLQADMALGIDATSRYLAAMEDTELDFDSESPYNTRTQVGLPPTPIGVPSEYALSAAITPAEGDWLYYVLTAPKTHTFTVTYDDFLVAKQTCVSLGLCAG